MKSFRMLTLVIILLWLMQGTGFSREKDVSDSNSYSINLPDFSAQEVNLRVNAGTAASNAKEAFREDRNLEQNSRITVLDEGIYHSAFTNKSWWYVKLINSGIGDTYLVSTDNGSTSRGWGGIENYELQQQSNTGKISPVLSSEISKLGPERMTVIIVLKDQPDIRAIVRFSEEKFINELNKTIENKDFNKTKYVISRIRNEVIQNAEEFNLVHGQEELISELDMLKAEIKYNGTIRNHIIATVHVGDLDKIAKLSAVQSIEPNLNCSSNLDVSTRAIHADWVWPFVQGNSYTSSAGIDNEVSVFDSGIDCTHPATPCYGAWNYVSAQESTTDDLQGHGTHVAGIVGSQSTTYRGVAPNVKLLNEKVAYKTTLGASSPWDAVFSALQHSYSYHSEIVQYSYGWYPPDSSQDYYSNTQGNSEISRTFDAYVEAGLTSVISAGNSGSSFDTICVPGDAFNVITAGSFNDKNTHPRSDDEVSSFSSRGYTGDSRTKPDVAAPGSYIMSANAFWEGAGNDFVQKSGTSMAAPHVSGLAALLIDQWARQYGERLSGSGFVYNGPMAIRAMIYNSADETTGENPSAQYDRITGTGYIDACLAAAQADKNKIQSYSLTNGQQIFYPILVNPGDRIKATVVWNRHVNLPPNPTSKSVSDIDLALFDSNSNLLSSSASSLTNWEKITYTYTGASPTTLNIRIWAWNVPLEVGTETVVLAAAKSQPLQIALRAANGQYVCAEGGGGRELQVNRNAIDGWETFDLVDLGMNMVALRAANGQYVCAEGGGGSTVAANCDAIGDWETFRVIELGSGNIALQAYNGQYVCAEGGGGREVVANRNAILAWETFRMIRYTNYVSLRAANGQYVCAEGSGGREIVANRNAVAAWEKFRLLDLGESNVALQAANGQYVCAEGGGGGVVVANRNAIGAWERFRVVELGNGNIALQAANGQYVCAEYGGGSVVVANRNAILAWETFYREYR